MITIAVFSRDYIEIDGVGYQADDRINMVNLLKSVIDKVHYGRQKVLLEACTRIEDGKVLTEEVGSWPYGR